MLNTSITGSRHSYREHSASSTSYDAVKAKIIAKGDLSREIEVQGEDEIGELGATLNILSRRIRENVDELKSYGERTKEINMEISKKVLVLSNLLQIGNLISQGSPLDDILNLIPRTIFCK